MFVGRGEGGGGVEHLLPKITILLVPLPSLSSDPSIKFILLVHKNVQKNK